MAEKRNTRGSVRPKIEYITISEADKASMGCPHCEHHMSDVRSLREGLTIHTCGKCGKKYCTLIDGMEKHPFIIVEGVVPEVKRHPFAA